MEREYKGNSLIDFPENYVVVDCETTGLDAEYDSIIEVAALRVRNNTVVDSFSSLVNPGFEIDPFIEELTGITNDMLHTAPMPQDVFPAALAFLGDDIIVGHNVNFDINFLYDNFTDYCHEPLKNDFVDTLRISRKALPELPHHRLKDIADAFSVTPSGAHRSLADCQTTFDCYLELCSHISSAYGFSEFVKSFKHHSKHINLHDITTDRTDFDETHPLFGKHCVFTGALERMTRADAAQLVVNVGGICDNGVTKKTNFLILGNNDYCAAIKGGKSSKHKKAEEYKLNGLDIEIIPENVFYEMLES